MLPVKKIILRLLYYSHPAEVSKRSLVTRIRAIQTPVPSLIRVQKQVQVVLKELEQEGLCKISHDRDEETALITDVGIRSLGGDLDERLEIRRAQPVEFEDVSVPSGVPGLDELISGGIPSGSVVLVKGSPGSGKTILASQFLYEGIKRFGEAGIFVSFEVPKIELIKQAKQLHMDLSAFDGKQFEFIDAAPVRLLATDSHIERDSAGMAKIAVSSLCDQIRTKIDQMRARRLVIDPLTSLSMLCEDALERRLSVLSFLEALRKMGVTVIATAEETHSDTVEPEEYLSDGLITLRTVQVGRAVARAIAISKMRRRATDYQPRPYKIGEGGIQVFTKESIL
jgi:KaiC/GvpD/RAD55 family RecA-like ATPase